MTEKTARILVADDDPTTCLLMQAALGKQGFSVTTVDNGNLIGLTSSYETQDGVEHQMADVWFIADKVGSLVDAMANYAPVGAPVASASPLPGTEIASSSVAVGGMVSALSQFDENGNPLLPASSGAVLVPTAQSVVPETKDLLSMIVNSK